MHQALIVWIAVVAISGIAVVSVIYAMISAEPPTLELSEKGAGREQMPSEDALPGVTDHGLRR